VQQEG
jgi:tetratricopeptide (TPR) repeat protein